MTAKGRFKSDAFKAIHSAVVGRRCAPGEE